MNVLHIAPSQAFIDKFIAPLSIGMLNKYNLIYMNISPSAKNNDKFIGLDLDVKLRTNKFRVFLNVLKLVNVVHSNQIDKVFLHTSVDSVMPMIFLRIFTRAELIYVNHGVPYVGYTGLLKFALKFIDIINVGMSYRTLTITGAMLHFLEKCNYFKRSILAFSPGSIAGVDLHSDISFHELSMMKIMEKSKICPSDSVLVLYVGRPEIRKGLHDFISASMLMNINFVFLLVGVDDSDLVELHYNKESIIPLGYVDDPSYLFLAADFLCVPSYHEGLGQVYLEAAASGAIPICCNIPGPTDFIVNNENGLSVDIHDVKAIANNIQRVFVDKTEMRRLSMNAFNSVKKYSRSDVVEKNVRFL